MSDKPVRILHVVPNMQAGGLETLIMNLYRNIDRSKVQFDFLVHYQGNFFYDDEIRNLGGKIYKLSLRDDNNIPKYFYDLNKFFENHSEYKIVHGHMESTGRFYLRSAYKHGIPVRIAHAHNTSTDNNLKGILKSILLQDFKRYATDFFACSDKAGKYMFKRKDFKVLKNAIMLEAFTFDADVRRIVREELGIENNIVIGHIGRFTIQKNHVFIIDVFNEISKLDDRAVLILCGQGEKEKEIKTKVAEYGLDEKIRFLGTRKDVARIYQAMDCFLFPSLYEGLGIVAIEAQCSGLPVIGSDVIPKEVAVTDCFHYMPLDANAEKWAIKVLESVHAKRKPQIKKIRDAGYDIRDVTLYLQKYYLEKSIMS
ncbi:MAG: glycosyltransferase family 1 protein [Lachnospiraceae bacterium]|nr:glycosyltransferase family 1 protein [Lachnospiraceae bacterium]